MTFKPKLNSTYQIGGCLCSSSPMYIERQADIDLYEYLKAGKFCFVLNSRQMGKSSLRVRTMKQLKQEGFASAAIEMRDICQQQVTSKEFCAGLVTHLVSEFKLEINEDEWWNRYNYISPFYRLSKFIAEELLEKFNQHIIIFIDEIDSILNFYFKDDFFAFIRSCYNKRAEQAMYKRLNFALLGVATPADLIEDKYQTPLNIESIEIELSGFTLEQAKPLEKGLPEYISNPTALLNEILVWTGGQPFLTQWLCQLVSNESSYSFIGDEAKWVEQIVRSHVINNYLAQDKQMHLRTIRDRILKNEKSACSLLGLHQKILEDGEILSDASPEQMQLRLSGLVINQHGKLKVANLIYKEVFNKDWTNKALKDIRPYGEAIAAWLNSNCQDESQLLQGQTLLDARYWETGKSLSDYDYRFILASEALEKKDVVQENTLLSKAIINGSIYFLFVLLLAIIALIGLIRSNLTFQEKQQASIIDRELEKSVENDTERLVLAIKAGQRLQTLVKNGRTLQEYPTIEPILALQRILPNLDQGNYPYSVYDVDFSPDGKSIVTAHGDGTAKIWGLSAKHLATLKGHKSSVWRASFSADGQHIATVGLDNTLRIWNLLGQQTSIVRWEPYGFNRNDLILAPDWQKLIGVDYEDVSLLNLKANTLTKWRADHSIYDFSLSHNGKTLATIGEDDNTIRLWDLFGKKLREWKVKDDGVSMLFFISNEAKLFSVGNKNIIKTWNYNGDLLSQLQLKINHIQSINFSQDGQIIATAGRDNNINIWNLSGKQLTEIKGKPGELNKFSFSPDRKRLVTGGNNGAVSIWSLSGTRIAQIIEGKYKKYDIKWRLPKTEFDSFIFSASGKYIATIDEDSKTAKLWNNKIQLISSLNLHQSEFKQILFSHDEKYVVTVTTPNKKMLLTVEDTSSTVAKAKKINSTVHVWDTSGKLVTRLTGYLGNISKVDFSPNSQLFFTEEEDKTVRLWKISGEQLAEFKLDSEISDVSFSADGEHLATVSENGKIQLWNFDKKQIAEYKVGQSKLKYVRFSPNCKIIFTAEADGILRIWDISGRKLAELGSYDLNFKGVHFSHDSQRIATLDSNKARIWESSGRQIGIFSDFKDFTPDGQQVITGTLYDVRIQSIKRLDELLVEGCDWLEDYFKQHPEALKELDVCREKLSIMDEGTYIIPN
jgi:WD40 repeat protein